MLLGTFPFGFRPIFTCYVAFQSGYSLFDLIEETTNKKLTTKKKSN